MTKESEMIKELEGELLDLAALPDGLYDMNQRHSWRRLWMRKGRGGWVTVDRRMDGKTSLMLTNGKHEQRGPGALSITITPQGQLVCYMESVIRLWIKWGWGRGGEAELRSALDYAKLLHSRLCCPEPGGQMPCEKP